MKRSVNALIALIAAAMVLVACGSSDDGAAADGACNLPKVEQAQAPDGWNDVVSAAVDEGTVTLYSARQNENIEALIAAFTEVCPAIKVDFTRAASGELITKAEAEKDGGVAGADVLMMSELAWLTDKAGAGELLELGPNAASPIWAKFVDETNHWGQVSIDPLLLAVNTDEINPDDVSLEDIATDGSLKNQVGLLNAKNATTTGIMYMHLQEVFGEAWEDALAEQQPQLFPSATPMAQSLASGENAAVFALPPSAVINLQKDGAPVEFIIPAKGYMGYYYGAGALGWSKHPNAARVFTDFIFSVEGQTAINGDGASASPIDGIENSLTTEGMFILNPAEANTDAVAAFQSDWARKFEQN